MQLHEFYRGKRVFVTGHTGFKGSWLCRMLLEAGAQVESIYRPLSATEGEKGVLMDKLEEKSEAQEQLLNRLTLEKVMKDLAPQEKELILRRYFYNQTQMETAKALGVSQVQVSRLEKKCLKELRKRFEG